MQDTISQVRGSGRVFTGSGIWPKYGAGILKTINILAGSGFHCFKGSGTRQNLGTGCGISFACLSGIWEIVTAQIGTIKLVTKPRGTIKFLESLGKLHRAFSGHHKHQQHENCTLKEAHQTVKTVSSYCNATVEKVKSSNGITSTTNGSQGTIAAKTATPLSLLENDLERLDKNIDILSPRFSIKPEVCLTT